MEIRLLVLMETDDVRQPKVVVLSVFILAKSSTMSYAYEKGIGNPSGQQYVNKGAACSYRGSL
jgi:hypothetical protein